MTQPAATKVLMDIEEMLESRLFDRLPRGMRPNELGLFTLRYAHSALDGHRKFVDEFSTLKQGATAICRSAPSRVRRRTC